jgi:hypothetical protein
LFLELVCFAFRFLDLYDWLLEERVEWGEWGVNGYYERKVGNWWFKGCLINCVAVEEDGREWLVVVLQLYERLIGQKITTNIDALPRLDAQHERMVSFDRL